MAKSGGTIVGTNAIGTGAMVAGAGMLAASGASEAPIIKSAMPFSSGSMAALGGGAVIAGAGLSLLICFYTYKKVAKL